MTTTLTYRSGDPRTVWVFKIDLPAADLAAFNKETFDEDGDMIAWPLKEALGASILDHDGIEIVDLKAIKEYGFSTYLSDANGMDPTQVKPMATQLNSMTGHALLVFSSAFDGPEATMAPRSPLRHIATFTEAVALTPLPKLETPSAKGVLESKVKPPKSDARIGGMVATVALLVMFALVGVMIWIAG